MFTSLLMKDDTSSLKESSAGTTSMKKESNTMLASNQSENGLVRELESSNQRWTKESSLSKKNSEDSKRKKSENLSDF